MSQGYPIISNPFKISDTKKWDVLYSGQNIDRKLKHPKL